MARTTGTSSVKDLLRRGVLREGESLMIRRRSASSVGGTVQGDGMITVGKTSYSSPSAAARAALGVSASDGWIRWRVPRLGERTLAEVREEAEGAR
jgi:hypothetical protein